MAADKTLGLTVWRKHLVAASLIPFALKSADYLLLRSFVPIILCLTAALLLLRGARKSPKAATRAIKVWASALIVWGAARLIVMAMFLFTSVSEAHVESQLTLFFLLLSLIHLGLGIYFIAQAKPLGALLHTGSWKASAPTT